MKQLRSTYSDLQRIFTQGITVREIAEPLATFDHTASVDDVHKFMEDKDFDVVGILDNGKVSGYARRQKLSTGKLGNFKIAFREDEVVDESEPLLAALKALKHNKCLFVRFLGQPSGIVTRGDLQKAPTRMWLFGLITLFEMQMLRCIRRVYPDESWKSVLTAEPIRKAEEKLTKLKKRNEATSLDDCLTLEDKAIIFKDSKNLLKILDMRYGAEWWQFFSSLRDLRNDLAHAGDFMPQEWTKHDELINRLVKLLVKLETTG
ncbi:MAG: hypothetical protein ACKO2G_08650 [Verrucomicrobiales bacterium]